MAVRFRRRRALVLLFGLLTLILIGSAHAAHARPVNGPVPAATVGVVALADGPVLPPGVPPPSSSGPPVRHTTPAGREDPSDSGHHHVASGTVALSVVLVVLGLGLFAVSATTLTWMLHAWRSPGHLDRTRFRGAGTSRKSSRSFTLLVPARHEEAVLGQTLDALAAATHDRVEVIAIIGHDDPGTREVAEAAAARHRDRVRVVIDDSVPKNKPKALNTALVQARGDIVGVFDAEDDVHPDLLRHVDGLFSDTGADVVQAGVQLMNVHTTWWSLRNCLEYYFWFRSRLHFHADAAFIPLGGNTVFTRRELLIENGGWDPECLAEDCEIGVRLSSNGARVAVAYDSKIVTREETPDTVRALVKQRTRWNQGFLQVLGKGVWRTLPARRQRLLARYTLAMPFLQALTGLLVPASLALMFLVRVPTPIVLLTLLPIAPTLMTIAMEMVAYSEFCRLYGTRRRLRAFVYLVLGAVPYQLILAFSAIRAVVRQSRGQGGWEKTAHANLHRRSDATPVALPERQEVA